MPTQFLRRRLRLAILAPAVLLLTQTGTPAAQGTRNFSVAAHKYAFAVAGASSPEIRVTQGDLVQVTFSADDIPHSFTTMADRGQDDHYRINRRAEPGKPATFEFRADKAGKFPIRCTLTIDDRCHDMEAWIIVDPKK